MPSCSTGSWESWWNWKNDWTNSNLALTASTSVDKLTSSIAETYYYPSLIELIRVGKNRVVCLRWWSQHNEREFNFKWNNGSSIWNTKSLKRIVLGEHSFSVTFYSRSRGVIEFMLNWKCFQGELPFNSKDELLEKARQLLEMTQGLKS